MKQTLRTLTMTVGALAISTMAFATTIMQFTEVLPFNTPVIITAGAGSTNITASKLVTVSFDTSFCLVVGCGGVTSGSNFLMTLNANSTGAATNNGSDIFQNFAGTVSFTNGATNLLTIAFSDIFQGSVGGTNPTLNASQPPDSFTGTSTVFDPAKLGVPRGFAFSFSNLTGGGLGTTGVGLQTTIRSGLADISGTINATAPTAVPEPASMVLLGSGLLAVARRVRKARA